MLVAGRRMVSIVAELGFWLDRWGEAKLLLLFVESVLLLL